MQNYVTINQALMFSIILVVHAYLDIIGSITEVTIRVTISGVSNNTPILKLYGVYSPGQHRGSKNNVFFNFKGAFGVR